MIFYLYIYFARMSYTISTCDTLQPSPTRSNHAPTISDSLFTYLFTFPCIVIPPSDVPDLIRPSTIVYLSFSIFPYVVLPFFNVPDLIHPRTFLIVLSPVFQISPP